MEADVEQDMETQARKKDAAADAKFGDILSVEADDDPTSLTSFGDKEFTESLAPTKYSGDALVDQDAEAPKLCLSLMEMRMPTPAGGLLHAGPASTTLNPIFTPQPPPWSFEFKPEEFIGSIRQVAGSISLPFQD